MLLWTYTADRIPMIPQTAASPSLSQFIPVLVELVTNLNPCPCALLVPQVPVKCGLWCVCWATAGPLSLILMWSFWFDFYQYNL